MSFFEFCLKLIVLLASFNIYILISKRQLENPNPHRILALLNYYCYIVPENIGCVIQTAAVIILNSFVHLCVFLLGLNTCFHWTENSNITSVIHCEWFDFESFIYFSHLFISHECLCNSGLPCSIKKRIHRTRYIVHQKMSCLQGQI